MNFNDVDSSDCLQMSYHDGLEAVSEANDAKGSNLNKVLNDERALFYDWGQQQFNFSRGRTLIFHDDLNLNHKLGLATCFKDLDYKVKMNDVKNIQNFISK
jgi:hypothetical protein